MRCVTTSIGTFICIFLCVCSCRANPAVLENAHIRAVFTATDSGVSQQFFAQSGDDWALVAQSLAPPKDFPLGANELYDQSIDPQHRHLTSTALDHVGELQRDGGKQSVVLKGQTPGALITQTVTLDDAADHFHVVVDAAIKGEKPRLEYVLSPFVFQSYEPPDMTHVPAHKRRDDNIIGDGVFYAPAAIVQRQGLMLAIAPDVDVINDHVVYSRQARQVDGPRAFAVEVDPAEITMPTGLDLELQSGLGLQPILSYGMIDHIVTQHVFWLHENLPGAMVRDISANNVRYAFDLFVSANTSPYKGYQRVSQHHWEKTGHKTFLLPRPQAMPLAEYAQVCYPAHMKYQGYDSVGITHITHRNDPSRPDQNSWQQWQENGVPMGGWRLTPNQWYDLIYNCTWWNNVCDATGMYYWGKRLGNDDWLDKAKRAINWTLSAPQQKGMYPSLYHLTERRWINSLWGPPTNGFTPNRVNNIWEFFGGDYMTSASSTTAVWLLVYYQTCEPDPRILAYVERYAEFLIGARETSGVVPEWFNDDLQPLPNLREFNANGGLHTWVLAELYRLTKKPEYLQEAKLHGQFVIDKVLPGQRWSDFETFYSCAAKPESFLDHRTGQPGRNLMSVSWAMNGLGSLYQVSGEQQYLDGAEAAADFGVLFQAVWAPHFDKVAYPFGGFAAQLGDGEWLDQRDHRFAGPLVRIGLLSGRQDLIERGVAASRASLVLGNHPRHKANDIYMHPVYPMGIGGENSIHGGYPQTALASGPSWNTVGGLAAAAHVALQLGGAYVDVARGIAIGVDGVRIPSMDYDGSSLKLTINNAMAKLPHPYEHPYEIFLRVAGLADDAKLQLSINEQEPVPVTAAELESYKITVDSAWR